MFKCMATGAFVCNGYEGASAIRFSESGETVRFRVGVKAYDPKSENKTRWINIAVKAFGAVCERIRKMQIKEGSCVNFEGKMDEESWTDQNTNEVKKQMVVVLNDIEYNYIKAKEDGNTQSTTPKEKEKSKSTQLSAPNSENFTGFEPFGGESFFDDEG